MPHSLRNAFTSSHIFRRSAPLGALPFAPLPFPDKIANVDSSSSFTSLAKAAYGARIQYQEQT
jgi:hypothetical protein